MNLTADQWQMVTENAPLVKWMLNKMGYPPDHPHYDDAYQDGLIGLAVAVKKWDAAKGRLSTVAQHWIRHHVQRGRGELEGVNFRRAYINTRKDRKAPEPYEPPLSMDVQMGSGEGSAFHDMLPSADDPASETVDGLFYADLVQRLTAACRDDWDHAALRCLARDGGWVKEAERLRVTHSMLKYRAQRLRDVALEAA